MPLGHFHIGHWGFKRMPDAQRKPRRSGSNRLVLILEKKFLGHLTFFTNLGLLKVTFVLATCLLRPS